MRTHVIILAVAAFVVAFTTVSQFTLAQEKPVVQPSVVQNAPKEAAEVKKPDFLKDLDKALKQGCTRFYLYTGWEKHESEWIVCDFGLF